MSLTLRKPKGKKSKAVGRKARQPVTQAPKVQDYDSDEGKELERDGESSEEDKVAVPSSLEPIFLLTLTTMPLIT